MNAANTLSWPAAKYLTYGFWRSWILVVYTAPIWGYSYFAGNAGMASYWMYIYSTIACSVAYIVMASQHVKFSRFISNKHFVCTAGLIASLGMALEFADLIVVAHTTGILFVLGALFTGFGTAVVSVRAGISYASTRPSTAVTNTSLSEVASGLIFFFVLGTFPEMGLLIAFGLPLLASVMTLFDRNFSIESFQSDVQFQHARRNSLTAFVRFLVTVALLALVASLSKGAFAAAQNADAALQSGVIGITVSIVVCFVLAVASSVISSFNFSVVYYPLVLLLAIALAVMGSQGNSLVSSSVFAFVYSLFSVFMWCILTYIARGDTWDAIQVFGWGRAAFALGSLAGWLVGSRFESVVFGTSVGIVLAFAVIAASMLLFRESDVKQIVYAGWLSDQKDTSTSAVEQVNSGSEEDFANAVAQMASGLRAGLQTEEHFADAHNLTLREREVFSLMLEGRDAKTIGEVLVISDNTAKAHIRSIYSKLGVHTRQEFIDETTGVLRDLKRSE